MMGDCLTSNVSERLGGAMVSPRPFHEVLDLILDMALNLTEAQYGALYWVNRRQNNLELKAARGPQGELKQNGENGQHIPCDRTSIVTQVAESKKPILVPDLNVGSWREQFRPTDPSATINSVYAVPLFSNDGQAVTGVLKIESDAPGRFKKGIQAKLEDLALHTHAVVQEACLTEAMQTLSRQVLTLDCEELLAHAVESLADLLYVPVCSIWLVDPNTQELRLEKAVSWPEEAQEVILPKQSFLGKLLEQKDVKPLYERNVQNNPHFQYRELAKQEGWLSALAVPISSSDGSTIGVTCLTVGRSE